MWNVSWLKRLKQGKDSLPERLPRFDVDGPLHFRNTAEFAWNMGQIMNLSRSGVLFQAGKMLPVETAIDLSFTMPKEVTEKQEGLVQCRGKIVRVLPRDPETKKAILAAQISAFRFTGGKGTGDSYS